MLDYRTFNDLLDGVPRLTPHPLAEDYRLMSGPELEALANDIATHGIREPIVINALNQILDGRNRYAAWLLRGVGKVPLRTRLFGSRPSDGDDEETFVVSANERRRHDDESQRAMAAARRATRQLGANQHTQICAPTQDEAARLENVSKRLVQEARRVLTKGTPELIAAVDSGVVKVSAAAGIVHLPPDRQVARIERDRAKANGTHRPADNYYRTPDETTDAVLDKVKLHGVGWEPACGDGAIAKRLLARGHKVVSSDLHDHGFGGIGVDFLKTTKLPDGVKWMMTNPPYGSVPDDPSKDLATEFIAHALDLGVQEVLVLCRLQFLEGAYRYARLHSRGHLKAVYVFVVRQTLWRGDDAYAEDDGGMTCYAWFHFDIRHHSPSWTGYWLGAPGLIDMMGS
jgi:hypothetical protein